jgi:hypothetical protein
MRTLACLFLLAAACATARGPVVAPADQKYVATADEGYTPKGHYTCRMESATGSNLKSRVCRYDADSQTDANNRERMHDDLTQQALQGVPKR